jgi:uncharacterized protein (TIGR02996 family)
MSDDRCALIAACKQEPEDDAPRLVLADWLEENRQDERAAFIRRQIGEPSPAIDDDAINPVWLGEWKRKQSLGWRLHASRGLIRISDSFRELYDRLDEILRPPFDWTWIDGLKFGSWHDGDWSPLFRSPLLTELNWLEFIDDNYKSNLVGVLVDCPFLSSLRHLRLVMVEDESSHFQSISRSPHLRQLKSLAMTGCALGRRSARAFATSEVWDNLEVCALNWSHLGDSALAEFATGRTRPNLKSLDISFGRYTDTGLVQFSRTKCFPALQELHVGYAIWPNDASVTFGPFGIDSILSASRGRPFRLIVSVRSREPAPREIVEFCDGRPDRVELRYTQPGHS